MGNLVERARRVITPALGMDTQLEVVRGEGVYVETEDGRRYIDLSAGTAVLNTGHRHPEVVAAAKRQIDQLIHAGCVYYYESFVKLAEMLTEITPGDIGMFFFSNAGAEAVEGAMKLARYVTGRPGLISFQGAFHGRTFAAISVTTSSAKYRSHYRPLLPEVYRAPYPYCYRCPFGQKRESCSLECLGFIRRMFRYEIYPDEVAAFIIEPVQGEGGYIDPPKEFIKGLREMADEHGIMLIFDEVQSGFGRTARWFAAEHFDVVPDIMAMAKGIASGFPLSAVASTPEIMSKWAPGAHGTTFGGNPVSCAAAIATIEVIREEKLLERAQEISEWVYDRLKRMKKKYKILGDVRGLGYMIGIELIKDGKEPYGEGLNEVRRIALDKGLIVIGCGTFGNVIRLIPPLIITREEMERAIDILEEAIKEVNG
jgi:4-aminobutyrate aminotransferase